ncbi:MAG: 3-methyl-2-oxobutanoate hydroxymethyltransferase [Tractidigestivibacter sp.]|jgi:3-methyl-2-oxobutanoate hydroxymethyltransferase|uniref:3-methyl-2-oxobutanoate hydroxymethyltransferase n=1 Tax=Tractidigestivibacter sp. TaxID=2847320 RepID=UPI003D91AC0E
MADNEHANIKMSTASKSRKNLAYLQKMKDNGEKIVQMCPAELGPFFAMAAEMVGCDICRIPQMLSMRTAYNTEDELLCCGYTIRKFREYTKIIHINFYMPVATYATKDNAVRYGAEWVFDGADSMLPMGITNDVLKHMSDNYVPTYGHIGAISGWQTNATGYKRVGKTAEDAFRIFMWGYEYQENGMGGMTIELTPKEVSQAIAEKLRVPVVSIAGGAPCDGSEMVDMDTFGVMPKPASHSKSYAQLLPFLCEAYMGWLEDVREGNYPEEKHGYHMDPQELEKFKDMMDKFEG